MTVAVDLEDDADCEVVTLTRFIGCDPLGTRDTLSWPDLFAELARPRDEFCKEAHPGCDEFCKKAHPGYSFATFRDNQRRKEHIESVSALALDVDQGWTLEEAEEALGSYAGALATTKSHTDAAHRFRVVLRLSRPVTGEGHEQLRLWIYRRYPERFDPQERGGLLFFFGGARPEVRELPGQPLDVDAILAEVTKAPAIAPAPDAPAIAPAPDAPAIAPAIGKASAEAAMRDEIERVREAPEGSRNDTLNVAAFALGTIIPTGFLDREDVARRLTDAATTAGLSRKETEATIRSGLAAGEQNPRRRLEEAPQGPSPIETCWTPVEMGHLIDDPPLPRWLLCRPDHEGFLPRGKVGLLVADGGVGKTTAAADLTIAVITGRPWLDHFPVSDGEGRVLLVLAEDDADEARRRIYTLCRDLSDDQRREVAGRLVVLPLAGKSIRFLAYGPDRRTLVDGPDLIALRSKLLEAEGPWSLVVLDPLSRFGLEESEVAAYAATQTMIAAESLASAPGQPTVLVCHHSSKASVEGGKPNARGSTGLRNAARWEASLRREGRYVLLAHTKSNSAPMMLDDLRLVHEAGRLRVETPAESLAHVDAAEAAEAAKRAELVDRAVEVVRESPIEPTKTAIANLMKCNRAKAFRAIDEAVHTGRLIAYSGDRPPKYFLGDHERESQ